MLFFTWTKPEKPSRRASKTLRNGEKNPTKQTESLPKCYL